MNWLRFLFIVLILGPWSITWATVPRIFIVESHLTGELNSMKAVAESLHGEILIKPIDYLIQDHDLPDFIFHALGNATEVEMIADFKLRYPQIKTVNFHDPLTFHDRFDLIIQASHVSILPGKNVITVEGVPTQALEPKMSLAADQWRDTIGSLPKPIIAVLIGGNAKDSNFTETHARKLGFILNTIRRNQGGTFVITNSRRTTDEATEAFQNAFKASKKDLFITWEAITPTANPYLGMLHYSDYIIVTGDSVSMISDSLGTGKPTFVYAPEGSLEQRHKDFVLQQFRRSRVKPLAEKLFSYEYEPLKATEKIVLAMQKKWPSLVPKRSSQCIAHLKPAM